MKNLVNIPEEITLIYCNPINTDKVYPAIVDKKLLTNKRRNSLQATAINSVAYNREDGEYDTNNFKEITVVNSDLMLSIDTGKDSYYNYDNEVYVRLLQKGNDVLDSYKFIVRCKLHNFFELLKNTFTINNGIISGSYCLRYNSLDSYIFVENLVGDKDIKESKRVSNLISSNRKTSKWIPGGKYYISPTEYVIYLGEYKDDVFLSYWCSRDRFKKCFNKSFSRGHYFNINNNGTLSLCIPYTEVKDEVEELINNYKGKPIDIFIKDLIKCDLVNSKSFGYVCAIKNSTKKGVLDEQLFLNNIQKDCNITNEVNNTLIDTINNCVDSKLELILFKIISKFNPNLIEKINNRDNLINKVKLGLENNLVNNMINSWYRDRYVNIGGKGILINGDFEDSNLLDHIISHTSNIIDENELIEYIQNIIDTHKNG